MTFTIENDGVSLSNGDHNVNERSFTLRTIQQTNLPLNEIFYLKIRGLWQNPKNPSDSFEYYLIYGCRFISKLILSMQPNMLTVLKGQTLTINH